MMMTMWLACTHPSTPSADDVPSPTGQPQPQVDVRHDEREYVLTVDGDDTTLPCSGYFGDPMRRYERPGCRSSVGFGFFGSWENDPAQRLSLASFYLTGHDVGSQAVLPSLDAYAPQWEVPRWVLDGTLVAAFDGTAEIVAADPTRVTLRLTDTLLCELREWPTIPTLYSDLVTDCRPTDEILLDAVATEPFDLPTEEELLVTDEPGVTPWTDVEGTPLCDAFAPPIAED